MVNEGDPGTRLSDSSVRRCSPDVSFALLRAIDSLRGRIGEPAVAAALATLRTRGDRTMSQWVTLLIAVEAVVGAFAQQ